MAEGLQITQSQTLAEQLHLAAGVVEIVLPLDFVAGGLQQPRQRITDDGAATAPDVQWAGGVGADEFDQGALSCADIKLRQLLAFPQYRVHLGAEPGLVQAEVEEAGRGDLDAGEEGGRRQVVSDALRNFERAAAHAARQLQRDGTGVIAHFRARRRANFNRGQIAGG